MLSELDKINHLKAILIDYATEHDNKNGGFEAIQSVQKMADYNSFRDYLHAICDGIWYGNWPWIKYPSLKTAIKNTLHKSNEGEEYIPSGHIDPLTGEKV